MNDGGGNGDGGNHNNGRGRGGRRDHGRGHNNKGRGRGQNGRGRGQQGGNNYRGGRPQQRRDEGPQDEVPQETVENVENGNNGNRRPNRPAFERKGPVFGFKRLNGFLTQSTDEVIMSIQRDIKDWHVFLQSDDLTAKSDSNLVLVIQILSEKICGETTQLEQRKDILLKANTEKFIAKVNEKCQKILMGSDRGNTQRRPFNGNSDFVEVDLSPKTFLKNLHKYCSCMAKIAPQSAVDNLTGVVASAYGAVRELNDTDTSYTDLMTNFRDLKQEIQNFIKQRAEKVEKLQRQKRDGFSKEDLDEMDIMEAPSDYKEMSIVPSVQELLSKEEVFLRPNKISGAYSDSKHYLDVQFRLLREDFVQPLKKGVQDFMRNRFDYLSEKKKIPIGSIRIYQDVQLVKTELVRDSFVYKVQLLEENYKRIKWDKSKRLLTGSLLVFTSNMFKNAYFAVVASRNVDELSKGIVSVIWEGDPPLLDRDDEYLMVECEVYFEAYRYTLQILKSLELETFPMCKFIVEASADVGPPKYLENGEHMMTLKLKDGREQYISPLMSNHWPSNEQLGLDVNQFTAFQAALTKEFAIIQGPPGTGKTFLGLKIAEVFLSNEQMWMEENKGPILAVCYTNHALDQFLEGILDIFTKLDVKDPSIVRVGGRCKSEKLANFSLSTVVRKKSRQMPRDFWPNKYDIMYEIDELRNQRSSMMEAVMALNDIQGIINFEKLDVWKNLMIEYPSSLWDYLGSSNWLGFTDELFNLSENLFDEDQILANWFEILPFPQGRKLKRPTPAPAPAKVEEEKQQQESDDDEDYDLDELLADRLVDDLELDMRFLAEADSKAPENMGKHLTYIAGLSVKDCDKQINQMEKEISLMEKGARNPEVRQLNVWKMQRELLVMRQRKVLLDKLFNLYKNRMIAFPEIKTILDRLKILPSQHVSIELKRIPLRERWAIFFEVVERARVLSAAEGQRIDIELVSSQKKLREIQTFADGWVLSQSKVVGMTTTGAAKYNDLVKMMQSKIVIVEEAAEVLESHIVTCITKHCEHLILIGDQKQLRPSTTVYDLARKFHLDVSLFERMINNNLNCYPLKVQHRMRPEIANLVVGTIYDELDNHPSVRMYPPVLGVTKNLFFISHNEPEKAESDSKSKSNEYEAKFLASLCRYLILQGYSTDQITVLTTYTGQMFLLKRKIYDYPNCRGVRITCVDNYQGEENDIILLSLVRSNPQNNIGFLNVKNRVCVAISRAKHGMFIIGNMQSLCSKTDLWKQLKNKLDLDGQCGNTLTLECQLHGVLSEVQTPSDFNLKVPEGGCIKLCDATLACTHKCNKICHVRDVEHKEHRCQENCLKKCVNQHNCRFPCFQKCPPCNVQMRKILPCLHEHLMPCHQDVSEIQCVQIVTRKLPCGHEEDLACFKDPSQYICRIEVVKELPCKHLRTLQCHVDVKEVTCKEPVLKTLPCGHSQTAECRFDPTVIKCQTLVTKTLEKCKHKIEVACCNANKPVNCRDVCTIRLNCGHQCSRICHVEDDPQHLSYICKKDCAKSCNEGHNCKVKHKCHTDCPPCTEEVERNLRCGHVAKIKCHINVNSYECLQPCDKTLNCLHKCQSLCFQPCGPCEVIVKKRIYECGHPIEVSCGIRPTRESCKTLVVPANVPFCGHVDTLVPCSISLIASPMDIMEICTHPCSKVFSELEGNCGHTCLGTCSKCLQGRLHEKCQEQCGKTLVCGHVCEFPCSKSCPPCLKQCLMKCEHSQCNEKCGTPCRDCSEKCPWQCPKECKNPKQCSKLCRETCDREPCNEPCEKKLKCGHSCISFCGEVCPPQCRICDKEELTEEFFLYGTEGEEDSRFVFLPDCQHAIEVEGLEYHLNLDDGEIGLKRCPRCSTVIRNCRRFNNIIRSRLKDVILVKNKMFGNREEVNKQVLALSHKLKWDERWPRTFPSLHEFILDLLVNKVPVRRGAQEARTLPKLVDESSMASIKFLVDIAEGSIDLLYNSKEDLGPRYTNLLDRYRNLFAILMSRKLPFSQSETQDIVKELERLHDLNLVYKMRSSPRFYEGHTRALPIYAKLERIVLSHKPYARENKEALHAGLKELEEILKTGLGISEMERKMIVQALNMQQGRWFKCPNGHPYVITECGGAMQEAKCPECNAMIGGGNHQLRGDNQFAPEMDGAARPLWPNVLNR